MQPISDILANRDFSEPQDEVERVKRYILTEFGSESTVISQDKRLIVMVPSAALASTLRIMQPQLIEACDISKSLVIRIGK